MNAHRSMSHGPAADRVSSRHRRCGTARDFAGRRAVSFAGSKPVMADETDAHLQPPTDADGASAPVGPTDAEAPVTDTTDAPPAEDAPAAEESPAPAESPTAEGAPADGASAEDAANGEEPLAVAPTAPAEPAVVEPSGPKSAVELGLLPPVFVSAVSTQLFFHAPPPLPPLPAEPDVQAEGPSSTSARRRSRRRGERAAIPPAPRRHRLRRVSAPSNSSPSRSASRAPPVSRRRSSAAGTGVRPAAAGPSSPRPSSSHAVRPSTAR